MNTDILLTEKDLAARFQLTTRTIRSWKAQGTGPASIELGDRSLRYRLADVLAYEDRRSTGGAIPADACRGLLRAAEMLDIIERWKVAAPAREQIGKVREELRALLARPNTQPKKEA